jgi:hypothetical protein
MQRKIFWTDRRTDGRTDGQTEGRTDRENVTKNILDGRKEGQVPHIVGSVFGSVRFLLPVCRLSWFLYTLNMYAHFSSHNNIQRHPHSQKTGKPNNLEKNAMKNEHICSMCIKINKVGKKEVGI